MAIGHWRVVPTAHRRWIVINAVIISALSNLVINSAIAWISSVGKPHISLWSTPLLGGPNLVTDTLGTFFLLPFTTCLVVTLAVRQSRSRGLLHDLESHERGPSWLTGLPTTVLRRGVRLGWVTLLACAPVSILILAIGFDGGITRADFVAYKAVLGLVLGLAVTPVIALAAMGDEFTAAPTGSPA